MTTTEITLTRAAFEKMAELAFDRTGDTIRIRSTIADETIEQITVFLPDREENNVLIMRASI